MQTKYSVSCCITVNHPSHRPGEVWSYLRRLRRNHHGLGLPQLPRANQPCRLKGRMNPTRPSRLLMLQTPQLANRSYSRNAHLLPWSRQTSTTSTVTCWPCLRRRTGSGAHARQENDSLQLPRTKTALNRANRRCANIRKRLRRLQEQHPALKTAAINQPETRPAAAREPGPTMTASPEADAAAFLRHLRSLVQAAITKGDILELLDASLAALHSPHPSGAPHNV